MRKCAAIKPTGERCQRIVGATGQYCYSHDPERSDDRYRAASKAGKTKPNRELRTVVEQAQRVADKVLAGELDPKRAAVANQCLQTKVRALEVEGRLKEIYQLEEEMQALEERIRTQGRGA